MEPVVFAFLVTLAAGLSTGIGGALGVLGRAGNHRVLAASLGLSAGVMLYVGMIELVPSGRAMLAEDLGEGRADAAAVIAFFGGIAVAAVIDRMIPAEVNPHEVSSPQKDAASARSKLARSGVLTAVAVGLHNFPEGFATFMAALGDPALAIPVAVAIALHNIPEGVAVAVPLYHATGNRGRAFGVALASGFAEPAGALLGFLLLKPILGPATLGASLAAVAGIMVFISLDELLPTAEEYGEHHTAVYSLIVGMLVMAVTLVVL